MIHIKDKRGFIIFYVALVTLRDKSQQNKRRNKIPTEKVYFPTFPLEIHFLETQ